MCVEGGGGSGVSCLRQHVAFFTRVTLSRVLGRTQLDYRIVFNIHVNASRLSPSPKTFYSKLKIMDKHAS